MADNQQSAGAGAAAPDTPLQFATFSSQIELPFYSAVFSRKLDHDKLDDSARFVMGLYESRGEKDPHESTRLQIHGNALTSTQ